jgi:thioredoxin-related protein
MVPADVADSYHVTGYPTIYLVDSNGKIVWGTSGYYQDFEKDVEAQVEKLLSDMTGSKNR